MLNRWFWSEKCSCSIVIIKAPFLICFLETYDVKPGMKLDIFPKSLTPLYAACTIDVTKYIDSLVQDCSNSSALAMELLQSCTKPSICGWLCKSILCRTKNLFSEKKVWNFHDKPYNIAINKLSMPRFCILWDAAISVLIVDLVIDPWIDTWCLIYMCIQTVYSNAPSTVYQELISWYWFLIMIVDAAQTFASTHRKFQSWD